MITFRPKAYLPRRSPANLVAVPACDDCNSGASRDDKVFRNELKHYGRQLTLSGASRRGHHRSANLKNFVHFCLNQPPVAIDNKMIRETLWPSSREAVTPAPGDWQNNSFEAYSRYMTAIRIWENQRNWTTTQMEATIFASSGKFYFE